MVDYHSVFHICVYNNLLEGMEAASWTNGIDKSFSPEYHVNPGFLRAYPVLEAWWWPFCFGWKTYFLNKKINQEKDFKGKYVDPFWAFRFTSHLSVVAHILSSM